ncbi:MAG: M23 family metallopeptidase [Anaerolineales bacterium]|nr:M23 family metallopeptidase [Anaerolineales bacterium]
MTTFKFEAWPTEFRAINQYFGVNPQNYAQFGLPGHEGLDIQAPDGSKVFAVAPGRVSMVRLEPTGHNYGIHVRVDHIEQYQTTYAHLRQCFVSVGQNVTAGMVLGLADNTGNSFGSHLHLTLKKLDQNYLNWPSHITDPTPFILPLLDWQPPAGPYVEGWAYVPGLTLGNGLAQANAGGINLRADASINGPKLALVPAGTIMIVTGAARGQYLPVKVARAAVGLPDPAPPAPPAPPPAPTIATVDGWGFAAYLTVSGAQAVVGQVGINLRAQPQRTAANIGLVRGGSTVSVLGAQQGEYRPVRVRQVDFQGPVVLPPPAPAPGPAPAPNAPPAGMVAGWAFTQNLALTGRQAVVGALGINLRASADTTALKVGLVKEGAQVQVTGPARNVYTPIWARREDILDLVNPLPPVAAPDPFPAGSPPLPPVPIPDTTPGFVFTTQTTRDGDAAVAGQYGLNLRETPRRDGRVLGFVPGATRMIVTGPAQGEYTPVRVDDRLVQPPFDPNAPPAAAPAATTTTTPPAAPAPAAANADPQPLGHCRIGLHASADPGISAAEIAEFAALRPGIIKVLSFHGEAEIRRLAADHPTASWVVRAFLDFGGRTIGPDQFLTDTLPDVRRALGALAGRDVVVELHNEPNIIQEGLGKSWTDGASFAAWWLDLLAKYRQALPGVRFIYPGLSPGSSVSNLKQDHIQFLEAGRRAVDAADGLGVHIYWSAVYPMKTAIGVLDDFISRFRFKPIWITEASNNKAGTSVPQKAQQYLQFWQELQRRATVQGVTFFVASASDKTFAEEVWVGRGLGALVGRR